jgi:hypothetical protein
VTRCRASNVRRSREVHVYRGWAGTHGELSEARCTGPRGHRLSVHGGRDSVDLCRDVLFESLIRSEAGIRVEESE